MWAIRRASNQFRNKGLVSSSGRVFCGETEFAKCCIAANIVSQETILDGIGIRIGIGMRFYSKSSGFKKEFRTFSSQVGAKSNEKVEFSELDDTPKDTVEDAAASGRENDDDLSEDESNADDALNETAGKDKFSSSPMCNALLSDPCKPASKVLDKWVKEGNEVTESEIRLAMDIFRKLRLFVKALQLSEWLETRKHVDLNDESTCNVRVDLIAKVHGIFVAEIYVKQLPESLRTEKVYCTLLANCVFNNNVKKAEELFKKMKDSEFPITCSACNQMLLMYKKNDRKKIADVLVVMEKEGIKPSVHSYQHLIDVRGQFNDIEGMEHLLEKMETEGLKPSFQIQASVAQYYAYAGLKDKAEAVLKELEACDVEMNRWVYRTLIPIYASLGRAEEVERIWKICESDPYLDLVDFLAVIKAWGQLKKFENAEAAFNQYLKKVERPPTALYVALLRVYAKHKMLDKGKELVNQMAAAGCKLGPLACDALVNLYTVGGELEKAESILTKAIKNKKGKPLVASYIAIMDKYANRGDVHNTEKMFRMMKDAGYTPRVRQYQSLLMAYLHANEPVYGFRERMKADSVVPTNTMIGQLAGMGPFRKAPASDLLV